MSSGMTPEERDLSNQRILARLAKDTYVRVYFVIGGYPTVVSGTLEGLSRGYVSIRDALGSISDIPLHTVNYVRVPEQEVLAEARKGDIRSRRARLLHAGGWALLAVVLVRSMMHFPNHHTAFPYVTLIVGTGGPIGYLIGAREASRDAVHQLSSMFAAETRSRALVHVAIWSATLFALPGLLLFANRAHDVGVLSAIGRLVEMAALSAAAAYTGTVVVRRIFTYRSR
jgi:hypothetical protein